MPFLDMKAAKKEQLLTNLSAKRTCGWKEPHLRAGRNTTKKRAQLLRLLKKYSHEVLEGGKVNRV